MYIATKDIDAKNLKVKQGQPLPNRFQNRIVLRSLKKEFGDDAFEEFLYGNDRYIAIERCEWDALIAELTDLRASETVRDADRTVRTPKSQSAMLDH